MSTNSLYLGSTNGICVNSIIKDKIREYMMGDSSPPVKSSIDVSTYEVNKENASVIHENKKAPVNRQDPVSTTDLGLPSSLNVSIHNSTEPCPHRQDLVTASIRRIGNSLDALLHESKNASQVKAVKKTSQLMSQKNADRMYMSSDQTSYSSCATLQDVCENYIQFITVNSSDSPDEEEVVTTTSESDLDKQQASRVESELQIIPVLPMNLLVPSEKHTAQISVITLNENLRRNAKLFFKKRSVDELPVTTEDCEKSNGESDSSTDKLTADTRSEAEDSLFSNLNGVKSSGLSVDDRSVTVTGSTNLNVNEEDLNSVDKNDTEVTAKVTVSLSNGVCHNVNDEVEEEDIDEAGVEENTLVSETETANDELTMDVDDAVAEESQSEMEVEITSKFEHEVDTEADMQEESEDVPTSELTVTKTVNENRIVEVTELKETEKSLLNEKQPLLTTTTALLKSQQKLLVESNAISVSEINEKESTREEQLNNKVAVSETNISENLHVEMKPEKMPVVEPGDAKTTENNVTQNSVDVTPSIKVEPVAQEESITTNSSAVVNGSSTSSVACTEALVIAPSSSNAGNSVNVVNGPSVLGVKRRADLTDELEPETERDGGISSSSSASGSELENNQDCKRIRFDESIFEEDERERLIREFVERSTENADEISKNCDKLQHEISALSDLARAKELEWNSIMRLLKLKEEMLERILFKRRHLDCQNKSDLDSNLSKLYKNFVTSSTSLEQNKIIRSDASTPANISNHVTVVPISSSGSTNNAMLNAISHEFLKSGNASIVAIDAASKLRVHRPILPKPPVSTITISSSSSSITAATTTSTLQPQVPSSHSVTALQSHAGQPVTQTLLQSAALVDQNSVIGEGRQGPIVDVKSIIADFRSKNPDSLPRRGRRNLPFSARGPDGASGPRFLHNNALISMANMAIGSGTQVRTNVSSTTHNDTRPSNFFLGPDSPLPSALNRPDLQIRHANMESLMLVNTSGSVNSSQPINSSNSGSSSNSSSIVCNNGVSIAPASITNSTNNSTNSGPGNSFQEALVKFAKMNEKRDISSSASTGLHITPNKGSSHLPPPPPYPEVTLHPVMVNQFPGSTPVQNSLLHNILTKTTASREHHASSSINSVASGINAVSASNIQHRPTTFSPTLARLLTAPERNRSGRSNVGSSNNRNTKSTLSEILNNKKTRTEVTITPVTTSTSCPSKNGVDVILPDDDDESEATDRLVIDEGRDVVADATTNVIPADQVPECQGCHKKAAQFVCAGCGNQWYCSRDCQVQAWEDHSEMCSG